MTVCALLFAFGMIFAAGAGLSLLFVRGGDFQWGVADFTAASWLLGSGVISFSLWAFSLPGARGSLLQILVAIVASTLLICGFRETPRSRFPIWPRNLSALEWMLSVVVFLELLTFAILSYKRTLGWDGLINWELKARYAFLNHGALPAAYLSDSGRAFTHPDYPLAIPFTELWVYLSLGQPHQFWAKAVLLIFSIAGAILLASLAARLTGRRWLGLLVAALLFLTPQVSVGTGGAVSGYADFPLSVVYLAAIGFLTLFAAGNRDGAFRLYAAILVLLPWYKREGTILWALAALAGAYVLLKQRQRLRLLALLPGCVLIGAWKIYSAAMHTAPSQDFAAPTVALIREAPHRIELISNALLVELKNPEQWSILWPLFLAAIYLLLWKKRTATSVILVAATVAPIGLYSATYFLSAWPDVSQHIETSLSRLIMQTVPLAWLTIAYAIRTLTDDADAAPHGVESATT